MKYLQKFNEMNRESRFKGARPTLEDFEQRLSRTRDIWEMNKIGDIVEMNGEHLGKDYNKFHQEVVPKWITDNYANLTYDDTSLTNIINDHVSQFKTLLKEEWEEIDHVYTSYEVGMWDEEYPNDPADGKFKFGVDLYKDGSEGYAVMCVEPDKWGNKCQFEKVDDLNELHNVTESSGGRSTCGYFVEEGSTFRNKKIDYPFHTLQHKLEDGGYQIWSRY